MGNKYILEYRYDEDTEWRFESEFEYVCDAQNALTKHVDTFNFIRVRVRKVKYIAEESIIGEYIPLTVSEDDP